MNKKQKMYQQIEEHGKNLLVIFPDAAVRDPVALCKKLRALEHKMTRANENYCNGVVGYHGHDYIHQRTLKSLTKILNPGDVTLYINGDPRGYALKVDDKWMRGNNAVLERDWGGYGILAPEFTGE